MPTLVKRDADQVRAKHQAWGVHIDDKPMFRNVVTLDVDTASRSWDRLAVSTPVIEFHELPVRLHLSFVRALKKFNPKRT